MYKTPIENDQEATESDTLKLKSSNAKNTATEVDNSIFESSNQNLDKKIKEKSISAEISKQTNETSTLAKKKETTTSMDYSRKLALTGNLKLNEEVPIDVGN